MRRACLLALVACTGGTAPAPAKHEPPKPVAKWQECTETARAKMEASLTARMHLEKLDAEASALTCVTIAVAGQPAYFVEVTGRRGDAPVRLHGVLALDGTTELIKLSPAVSRGIQIPRAMVWFETLDLDGDGTDDILAHRRDPRFERAEWLDVVAVRGDALVEIEGPPVAYEDPDLEETCRGTLTEQRAGAATQLVVMVAGSSGESEHCLGPGKHVLALSGDRLVSIN
jgi:hypothetical protein